MANTFRRTENKYLLEPDQWRPMLTLLRENMQSDAFDDGDGYSVCNIYYDNANNTLIRASVSKPLYKEKLRVRSYGVPDDGSKVYVEVKKKTKGVVSKRRISMRLRDVEPFLICGVIPPDLTEASLTNSERTSLYAVDIPCGAETVPRLQTFCVHRYRG